MWILIIITAMSGSTGRSIDHAEFSSRDRCLAAQSFSIKREVIIDAYCVQK